MKKGTEDRAINDGASKPLRGAPVEQGQSGARGFDDDWEGKSLHSVSARTTQAGIPTILYYPKTRHLR